MTENGIDQIHSELIRLSDPYPDLSKLVKENGPRHSPFDPFKSVCIAVGSWTCEIFALFYLNLIDVWPRNDASLKRCAEHCLRAFDIEPFHRCGDVDRVDGPERATLTAKRIGTRKKIVRSFSRWTDPLAWIAEPTCIGIASTHKQTRLNELCLGDE